ncbi:hypothetical protein ACS0TY_022824 [Phlomoides rotata]
METWLHLLWLANWTPPWEILHMHLKKTKYEDSDIKWKELDPKSHFSCQFSADLIACNEHNRFHHHKYIPGNCRKQR